MLFSSRVRVRIRFGVWLVSCYAHVFVLVSIVTVTLPPVPAHVGGNTTKSVTRGQCDARPMVTIPVPEHDCTSTSIKLYVAW